MVYVGTVNGVDYGFYLSKENLVDYIEITNEEHNALIAGQEDGKEIAFHKGKKPTLETPSISETSKMMQEIASLKHFLDTTDYTVIKIVEGVATKEQYQDKLEERANARARINYLERCINEVEDVGSDNNNTD